MRILITGANGQVGTALTQKLAGKAEILAVDRDELDITDSAAVMACVESFAPTVIINAAAHTAVDKAETEVELSFSINRDGPAFLAKAASKVDAVLIHISTDYVFNGRSDVPYVESDKPDPQGIYGESKLAGEIAVVNTCEKHVILRTAWVFGEHGGNFVKTMLRLGAERDSLGIVADQFGAPTYAGDIADALIRIAEYVSEDKAPAWGVYHFSGAPYVSWFEFANTIFTNAVEQGVLSKAPALKALTTADYPTPAARPANSRLNCAKVEAAFGIRPSDWQTALNQLKDYK